MLAAICTCLAVVAAVPAPAGQETRSLRLHVTDAEGQAVRDLGSHEVVVLEYGVARPVLRLVKDARPVTIALVVDSSVVLESEWHLNLRPALTSFLARLPAGTRVALWTSGARPLRRVDWTTDMRSVERTVAHVMLEGGNVLIDTIDEALVAISATEGRRMALVIVTGSGAELSSRDQALALDQPERWTSTEVHAVQIDVPSSPGLAPGGDSDESLIARRLRYERTLTGVTSQTGGHHEHLLSGMSAGAALVKIAADLTEAYVLTYATAPGPKMTKTKVLVSRPKVRIRHVPVSEVQ